MTPGYRGRPGDTECIFFFSSNRDVVFDHFWLRHIPRTGDFVRIEDIAYKVVEVEWPLDVPTEDRVCITIDHFERDAPNA